MQQIGRYQIIQTLGSGGFGTVYQGLDAMLQMHVAIKVFSPRDDNNQTGFSGQSAGSQSTSQLRERFVQEARMLAKLTSHPHIVNIIELAELPDSTPYYVMPYLPRSMVDLIGKDALTLDAQRDLPQALQPRRLPVVQALDLLRQVLDALSFVHQAGLVHRDIKPANVLLDERGQALLCDFGIAKQPDGDFSQSGVGMGSRNYMSPEQRESAKHVDARSDVYSAAVLGYRMLTGTLPIGRYQDPLHFAPDLPVAVNQLLLQAMAVEPNQRPKDALEFLRALQQASKAVDGAAGTDSQSTGTFVSGTGATLKSELKPLQQKIAELLKTEGMVDGAQLKALKVAADIAGVSETELTQLIAETKTNQTATAQTFIKWREKVEAAKAQHQGNIPADEREALLAGGALLGKAEAELARFLPEATSGKATASTQKSSQTATNHTETKKPTKGLLAAGIATVLLAGGGYYGYSSYQQLDVERTKDLSTWQQARLADTTDAYQQYLNQVPEGQYRQSAQKALETLKELENAKQKQVQNLIGIAQQWLMKLGYELTQTGELDARTKAAIKKFETSEKMLVTGAVDSMLLTKLEQVYWRNDQQVFEKAKTTHTEQSYQQYLDARADGKYRTQAYQGIETVKLKLKEKVLADAKTKADAEEKSRQHAIAEARAKAEAEEKARKENAESPKKVLASLGRFVTVPAGSFMMGCSEGYSECSLNEYPPHQVSIKAFKLMETEVTFAMWSACVQAGGCSHEPNDRSWGRGNRPVMNVSFDDITQQFIPWLNKATGQIFRLPTEAEWEYAARGRTTTKYSWGDSVGTGRANCDGCGSSWDDSKTAPVKSFTANGYGLYDMSGNVWEWTQDCWNGSYTGAPTNGSAWQQGDCGKRVVRGGSWNDWPAVLSVTYRYRNDLSFRLINSGFRLAQDL